MTQFKQHEVSPQMQQSGWNYLFIAVGKTPDDSWKHSPENEEFWLRPVYTWCEERCGGHYGAGMHRFWFSGQNRVLFRDEIDAIDFKLRWC